MSEEVKDIFMKYEGSNGYVEIKNLHIEFSRWSEKYECSCEFKYDGVAQKYDRSFTNGELEKFETMKPEQAIKTIMIDEIIDMTKGVDYRTMNMTKVRKF